jgi:adenylate cyclase
MSVTDFDTARTSQALLSHLVGWFGAKQACAPHDASDNSPVVHLKSRRRNLAAAPACDIAARLEAEQQRGRAMEKVLSQYVSPQVLARLMADPDGLSPGGETRDVTVLFADLRGFTALAEAMKYNPRRLTDLINAFLDPMTDIVLAHGGTIDKYMGDCVMAFWGAPVDDPAHARHAFDAAQAMLSAMEEIGRRLRATFAPEIDLASVQLGISIGINSGECVVGNVGGRRRFDYSVLGDPVNVASRLEGLCKAYDTPLLVGEETARRLGGEARLTQVDHIVLRGRTQRLRVFGPAPAMPSELAA